MSSSDDGRSPKRRRISYSSASPSPTIAQTKGAQVPPQTPPLSDRMSPQQMLPGLGMQHGVNAVAGSENFPTPPGTAVPGKASSSSERGGMDSEQQTPVPMDTEEVVKKAGDVDEEMTDAGQVADEQVADAGHRRTDHEREGAASAEPPLPVFPKLYKLSTDPLPQLLPSLSDNLLSLYDLTRLQATVARRDPVTNEKINPLRKHYAGKVKQLGLEGREKPQKKPDELTGLVDPLWGSLVQGDETMWHAARADAWLEAEDDTELISSKLGAALGGMRAGQLPKAEHDKWKDALGLEATATPNALKQPPLPVNAKAPGAAALLAKTAPATAMRNSAPASPRGGVARPERLGKRRRYDESSYEGYEEDGYSTGGGDDGRRGGVGAAKRQKRKDFPAATSPVNSPSIQPASGGSMVGVRSS